MNAELESMREAAAYIGTAQANIQKAAALLSKVPVIAASASPVPAPSSLPNGQPAPPTNEEEEGGSPRGARRADTGSQRRPNLPPPQQQPAPTPRP
jgi:hypothetical protein